MDPRRLISVCFVMISSSAQPPETLTASVGGNVTLDGAVEERGFLSYGIFTIAEVREKKLHLYRDKYEGRIHWNQTTGRFTLSGLQKQDSGKYVVDAKTGSHVFVTYELKVYDPVPTPVVSGQNSTLYCSLNSTRDDVTLQWVGGQSVQQGSRSGASVSLSVSCQQDLNASLQCVAENPAEKKTVPVDVEDFCPHRPPPNPRDASWIIIITITITIITITITIIIIITILCDVVVRRCCASSCSCCQKKSTAEQTEVVFTKMKILNQTEVPLEPSGSRNSTLTKVTISWNSIPHSVETVRR